MPNVTTCNALISACEKGNASRASHAGFRNNAAARNVAGCHHLRCLASAFEKGKAAGVCFTGFRNAAARKGANGHHPQRLDQRMREGQAAERACQIFRAMQQQGIVPEVITYSTLISACEKGMQPQQAMKVFMSSSSSSMSASESPGASNGGCCELMSWNCVTPVRRILPNAPFAWVRFSSKTHP